MGSLFGDLSKIVGEVKGLGEEIKDTLEEAVHEGSEAMSELKNEAANTIDSAKRLVSKDNTSKTPDEQD